MPKSNRADSVIELIENKSMGDVSHSMLLGHKYNTCGPIVCLLTQNVFELIFACFLRSLLKQGCGFSDLYPL